MIAQGPFEELLRTHDLPAKLNDLDAFMRTHHSYAGPYARPSPTRPHPTNNNRSNAAPTTDGKEFGRLPPAHLVALRLAQPKRDAIAQLRQQVEQLEWQNGQRQQELAAQQESLTRRLAHVHDTQRLYEEAVAQLLATPSGEMETLVDRMVHQTVPTGL